MMQNTLYEYSPLQLSTLATPLCNTKRDNLHYLFGDFGLAKEVYKCRSLVVSLVPFHLEPCYIKPSYIIPCLETGTKTFGN